MLYERSKNGSSEALQPWLKPRDAPSLVIDLSIVDREISLSLIKVDVVVWSECMEQTMPDKLDIFLI
jgi:hypothetical protein